jgi:Ca-activated chloride channel family protein
MESIAEAGRGQYHYVKVASDLDKVIADELAGIQATVATNVELHLKAPCAGVQVAEVLGYESHRDGDTVVDPMTDLFGGDSRKLLVKVHVPDGDKGKIGALFGELVFKNASGGELQRTAVSLGVDRTEDGTVASASVDSDVMAQVIQLDAAKTIRDAAQRYESGDQAGAVQALDASRHEIERKSAMYKIAPSKSADVLGELQGMSGAASAYAPDSTEGKDMLKSTKQKARVMSKK